MLKEHGGFKLEEPLGVIDVEPGADATGRGASGGTTGSHAPPAAERKAAPPPPPPPPASRPVVRAANWDAIATDLGLPPPPPGSRPAATPRVEHGVKPVTKPETKPKLARNYRVEPHGGNGRQSAAKFPGGAVRSDRAARG